jgi:hypothetical protein
MNQRGAARRWVRPITDLRGGRRETGVPTREDQQIGNKVILSNLD